MKGLLLKEWYMFSRSYMVFYFVFAILRIILASSSFGKFLIYGFSAYYIQYEHLLYVLIIPFMCVVSLIFEEREKWDVYRSALPFSKEQIVYSKYVFSTLIISFFVLISAIGMLPKLFKGYIEINDLTTMLTWIIAILITPLSIMFIGAFSLKNKARIIYLFSILLCSIIIFFAVTIYDEKARQKYVDMQLASEWMSEEKIESILFLTPSQQLLLLGISTVIFLVSMVLSIEFYKKSSNP